MVVRKTVQFYLSKAKKYDRTFSSTGTVRPMGWQYSGAQCKSHPLVAVHFVLGTSVFRNRIGLGIHVHTMTMNALILKTPIYTVEDISTMHLSVFNTG